MEKLLQDKKFKCAFCGGSGKQPHSAFSRCSACRGKGEVEFKRSVVECPFCKGKGKALGSAILSCIRCRGMGVIEKDKKAGEDMTSVFGERLEEITKKLKQTRKETEKKAKKIKKKLEPVKPFIKKVKKEASWLNLIKEEWKSIWGKTKSDK